MNDNSSGDLFANAGVSIPTGTERKKIVDRIGEMNFFKWFQHPDPDPSLAGADWFKIGYARDGRYWAISDCGRFETRAECEAEIANEQDRWSETLIAIRASWAGKEIA